MLRKLSLSSSIYLLGGGALGFTYWPPQISQKRVEYLKVLSLTVEPAYASLTVEHLKVLSLTVEPAYASSPLPLLNSRAPKGPYGRAPKGPLPMVEPAYASLSVEHLKVQFTSFLLTLEDA